jgi:SAM-dependent methyltransferase
MPIYDEFFDRPISRWGNASSHWSNTSILKNFLRITKANPERLDLLEIGCGRGYIGLASKALGFRSFTGVEPNRRLAQYCRELLDVDIHEELLPHLKSLADDSFDLVMSAHVLEHAMNPMEAREWCEEMYRVVRPGGHVLIVCPDAIDYKIYFWDADWSHGYPPTPKRVSQIYDDIGLETVFSGKMHLGRTGLGFAFLAHVVSGVIPTQLGDALTARIFGRPLVSGLKLTLWGLVFAVGKKPESASA